MEITIYSLPTCPKCKILKSKILNKGLTFTEVDDIKTLQEQGIDSVPQMKIDDSPLMDFISANTWINNWEEN